MTRSRRRNRRNTKKQNQNFWGYIIILVCLSVAIAVGYVFYDKKSSSVEIDPITNCPVSGALNNYAIVFDTTDSLSKTQSLFIERVLSEKIEASQKGDRFRIYFLDEDADNIEVAVDACNPGDGSEQSALISNQRRLKQRWEETFYERLNNVLLSIEAAPEANQSPILESLKYISIDAFVSNSAKYQELIIVSDLLQFSDRLNLYKPHYEPIDLLNHPKTSGSLPYLDGVFVKIYYVVREKNRNLQTNRHMKFWEQAIIESGGVVDDVILVK